MMNSGEDALKVDIDNVTLKTEGSDINIEVHTDKTEDSMLMFSHTVAAGTGGTSLVPLVDSDGHLQVDALSSALPSGAATAANQTTIIGHVDGIETLQTSTNTKLDTLETTLTAIETDQAAIETLLTAANVDHAANEVLLGTIDADTGAIKTAVEIIDNAISGSEMQVDIVADGAGLATAAKQDILETTLTAIETDIAANEVLLGTIDADTGAIKTAVEIIDNAISGSEMQVDIVADGAGLATSANQSTIIGHVDGVETLLGTIDSDTDAIKTAVELIDDTVAVLGTTTYSETSTKGNVVGAVRNDTLATLADTDNEIAPLQVNKSGALYTVEETGQLGAIYESGTTAVSGEQIIAIQFLEDTKFTTLTPASAAFIGTASGDGDNIVNTEVFPQGMTIFGRWTAFTLVTGGRVIAYKGVW